MPFLQTGLVEFGLKKMGVFCFLVIVL